MPSCLRQRFKSKYREWRRGDSNLIRPETPTERGGDNTPTNRDTEAENCGSDGQGETRLTLGNDTAGQELGAPAVHEVPEIAPDLQVVIQRWSDLAPEVRAAIVRMVQE